MSGIGDEGGSSVVSGGDRRRSRRNLRRGSSNTRNDEAALLNNKYADAKASAAPMGGDPDEPWGDNTTCVTGNTSEHSYSPPCEDIRGLRRIGVSAKTPMKIRCGRHVWRLLASTIGLTAILSPPLMVAIPKALPLLRQMLDNSTKVDDEHHRWRVTECQPDCEGLLLSLFFKIFILVLGVWALFFRRALADLPRLFLARACLLALVFMLVFSYWLFYGVRVVQRKETNYTAVVTFALSLVDALLFVHYLALILLELRHLRPEFKVRVVRSPDGEARTYHLGYMSIQQAAVVVLQNYYRDFAIYNPHLERLPGNRMKLKGNGGGGPGSTTGFKLYNLNDGDGGAGGEALEEVNTKALILAASRRKESSHNERFYEELDWERRCRKRRARLLTATEDAFGSLKRLSEEKGPCVPMDAEEAAQTIFPVFARPLAKFLRVTRQSPRHAAEPVTRHLQQFLSFDMSPRSFLDRFFSNSETLEMWQAETNWSLATGGWRLASSAVGHGTLFQLRCQSAGQDAGVQLLCHVTKLPFFNLTEDSLESPAADRFTLRLSSETSV